MFRTILLSSLMTFCLAVPAEGCAAVCGEGAELCACASSGIRYSGLMDVAMSKGKTVKGRPATFVLEDAVLICDLPKMGKMPGRIRIELLVKVDEEGRLAAEPESVAGVLKMPMGLRFKLKLEALKEARMVGRTLSFVLDVYGEMMGKKFPTSIHFQGEME